MVSKTGEINKVSLIQPSQDANIIGTSDIIKDGKTFEMELSGLQQCSDSVKASEDKSHPFLSSIFNDTALKAAQNSLQINKYPGILHIAIDSLENFDKGGNSSVSLSIFAKERLVLRQKYPESSFIKTNQYLRIPLQKSQNFPLKIKIVLQRGHDLSEKHESVFEITREMVDSLHNKLGKRIIEFGQKRTKGIFGLFNSTASKYDHPVLLRMYCSFISDEETSYIKSSLDSLNSLCKWIMVRKYAYNCLFTGEVNIKGENKVYSWKRRFVKWYGHNIYTFDVHTNEYKACISLIDAIPALDRIKKGIVKFIIDDAEIEMHCDTSDSLLGCVDSIYIIFPKIYNWI